MRVRFRTIIGAIGGATLAASVAWAATTTLTLGTANGPGGIVVLEGSTSGSVTVQPPAVAGATTFTLPGNNGSNTNVLQTDGSGNTSWVASGGGTSGNPTATAGPTAVNGSASTFLRSDGAPAIQKGTNAQFGIVEGDGSTITCVAGVCTAIGGSATSVVPGTTTVGGATAPCLIDNSTGTTMGCAAIGAGLSLSGGILNATGAGVDGGTTAQSVTGTATVNNAARQVKVASGWATGTLTLPAISAVSADTCIRFNDGGNFIDASHTLTIKGGVSDGLNGGAANGTVGPFTTAGAFIQACVSATNNWNVGPGTIAASTAPSHQFASSIAINGLGYTQPALADISGVNATVSTALAGAPQGNGAKVQLSTGAGTSGKCVEFDANGNTVVAVSNAACGSGGGSGALTQVGSTCSFSGVTNCSWTGLTGSEYELHCHDLTYASGSNDVGIQFGTGGTPTWSNGATDYNQTIQFIGGSSTNSATQAGFASSLQTTSPGSYFDVNLHDLSSSTRHKTITGNFGGIANVAFGMAQATTIGNTAVTAVRIFNTAGTNGTGGTCSLYALAN